MVRSLHRFVIIVANNSLAGPLANISSLKSTRHSSHATHKVFLFTKINCFATVSQVYKLK
jgi:hypothetical protein